MSSNRYASAKSFLPFDTIISSTRIAKSGRCGDALESRRTRLRIKPLKLIELRRCRLLWLYSLEFVQHAAEKGDTYASALFQMFGACLTWGFPLIGESVSNLRLRVNFRGRILKLFCLLFESDFQRFFLGDLRSAGI